jgi:uncharacterized RDD family membrane protein YckC
MPYGGQAFVLGDEGETHAASESEAGAARAAGGLSGASKTGFWCRCGAFYIDALVIMGVAVALWVSLMVAAAVVRAVLDPTMPPYTLFGAPVRQILKVAQPVIWVAY